MYVMIPSGSRPLGLVYAFMLASYVVRHRRVVCCLHNPPFFCPSIPSNKRLSGEKASKKEPPPPPPRPPKKKSHHQILATLALPSGTLAWQTISFRLVPHSWHSASSALSRQILPFDDGPTPEPAALS